MDYRTPLHHLLHKLMPSFGPADNPPDSALGFADTLPDDSRAPPARGAAPVPRPSDAWRDTTIDPELGTEIVEFPDGASADLMDEFFAGPAKRAD